MKIGGSAGWVVLLFAVFGCGEAGPKVTEEAQIYASIVGDPAPVVERDMDRCHALRDEAVAGDCALVVARQAAKVAGQPPETHCERIEVEGWRAECWFLAAEEYRRKGTRDKAARACGQSGKYANDCAQHLWQQDLGRVASRNTVYDLTAAVEKGKAMAEKWSAILNQSDAGSDFELRFWRRFYERCFEYKRNSLEIARCDTLSGADRERCRLSVGHLYMRRLRDRVLVPGGRAALCGLDPVNVITAGRVMSGLNAQSDTLLQTVLEEQYTQICVKDTLEPLEEGVMTPVYWLSRVSAAESETTGGAL